MDSVKEQFLKLLKQYKYIALILVLGLVLMLLPEQSGEEPAVQLAVSEALTMEEKLEQILTQIRGVGKVRVLLTIAQGEQTLYVYDEDRSESDSARDTVVITDSSRAQTGLVSQVLPPSYLGAVIVCQGGENPSVKLAIVEAVCDATGLTADKITVLKMK